MFKKAFICFISVLSLCATSIANQPKEKMYCKDGDILQPIKHKQNIRTNHNEYNQALFDDGVYHDNFDSYDIHSCVNEENKIERRSADATKDQYENNDSISAAKVISPSYDGTHAPTSYSTSLDATIHRNEWLWGLIKREVDVDYYAFYVFGKGESKITVSSSSGNLEIR